MRKSKFGDEQIIRALRRLEDGTPAGELCRKLGVSPATLYRWKRKYAGLGVSELRELKQLRDENRRLKQVVADLSTKTSCKRPSKENGRAGSRS